MQKGQFKKGQSGNPAGRPKGSGSQQVVKKALEVTFGSESAFWEMLAEQAKEGDKQAATILANRNVPSLKPKSPLTKFELLGDTPTEKAEGLLKAISDGDLGVDDGIALLKAFSELANIKTADEFEQRIKQLEDKANVQ